MLLTDFTAYLIIYDALNLLLLLFIGFTFLSLNFLLIQIITNIFKGYIYSFNYWNIQ